MFTEVILKNIKCFESARVQLAPLTVLVGKNDSGKSAFLNAIALLGGQVHGRLEWLRHGAESGEIVVRGPEDTAGLKVDSANGMGMPTGRALARVQPPYQLDVRKLAEPGLINALATNGSPAGKPLPFDGSNIVAAIDRLPPKVQVQLESSLIERVPAIDAFQLVPVAPSPSGGQQRQGFKEVYFTVRGGGEMPASQVSSGVLILLFYLTLVADAHPPPLILIEEPENGLHPSQLEFVVRQLYALTQARSVQVVMSTHSPYLLDYIHRDFIRVFQRDAGGKVSVTPFVDVPDINAFLATGMRPGEAWGNWEG